MIENATRLTGIVFPYAGLRAQRFVHLGYAQKMIYKLALSLDLCYFVNRGYTTSRQAKLAAAGTARGSGRRLCLAGKARLFQKLAAEICHPWLARPNGTRCLSQACTEAASQRWPRSLKVGGRGDLPSDTFGLSVHCWRPDGSGTAGIRALSVVLSTPPRSPPLRYRQT